MKILECDATYYTLEPGWFWGTRPGKKLDNPRKCTSGDIGIKAGDWHIGNYSPDEIRSSYEKPERLKKDKDPYTDTVLRIGSSEEVWLFRDKIYVVLNKEHYADELITLLILEHIDKKRRKIDKERRKFESLKREYLPGSKTGKPCEEDDRKIPEDVKIYVWRRDEGECKKCSSREKLEYDHIIPVTKGGSNTARNIELLCEKCNREKSANIG